MKKITTILMTLCAVALVSCSGGGKSPSAPVKGYLNALKAGNYEKAMDYCSVDKSAAEEFAALHEKAMGEDGIQSFELVKDGETISEDGEKATVKTSVTYESGRVEEQTFDVAKVDGAWKVDLTSRK